MSLSAWEQRALHSIENSLAGSDPELTTLVAAFTELASGEEMPAVEQVTPGSWPAFRHPARKARRLRRAWASSGCRRLSMRWAMLVLLLLTIISLISVALAFSRGSTSQQGCVTPWIANCSSPAPAGGPGSATHDAPAAHTS
jgi:hypothetical protein